MPLFRKGLGPHALPIAMSGVKLGERLLYLGRGRPGLFAALAGKAGLTGQSSAIVDTPRDAEALQRAAAREGVLVEIVPAAAGAFPHGAGSFDVAVIDSTDGTFGALAAAERGRRLSELARVMRPGGRLIVVETVSRGIRSLFAPAGSDAEYRSGGGATGALKAAGFRPVRILAERARFRFTEGINPVSSGRG